MGEKGEAVGILWQVFVYWELGYKPRKERCGRSAGVVLGIWGRVVNGWQQEIRSGCGDVRLTFDVIAEGCRVLLDPGFVFDVEVVVAVVGGVQGISGTVLLWLGGMNCVETARRAASRDRNSCI